jgi:bidirectional [NiFe] hydrogenase diaphorase subunit
MPMNVETVVPLEDRRWASVEATMRRHGYAPDALIETLHAVEKSFGHLSLDSLHRVALALRVPLSKVYGVATFYHLFTLKPPAQHRCVVCTGTACHVKGAAKILTAVEEALGIRPGEATPDGKVSLEVARCAGACDPAPLAMLDGEVIGYLTPSTAVETVRRWMGRDS